MKDGNFSSNNKLDSLINVADETKDNSFKIKIIDSVFNEIKHYELDSITRNRYLEISRIYYSLNNLKYVEICEFLLLNPSKKFDAYENSFCNYLLGNYYYEKSNYEKSYYHLSKTEKSFIYLKNNLYLGYTFHTKADILTFKKDFVSAELLSIKALNIGKKLKNHELIFGCYITLGNSSTGLNNYNKATQYFEKAIDENNNLISDSKYLSYKLEPLNYLSIVYQKQNNYKKAIAVTKEALNLIDNKNKEILLYSYLTNNLAYSKFKLGDKSSLNQFQETLKIGDSIQSIPIQITSKTYLGEYYLTEKDTVKANFYLKAAQLQAHKNNIFEDELLILKLLAQANPLKDAFYSKRYITLNDSLQNVERATRDKFARIEFETAEITQENKIIVKKNAGLYISLLLIVGVSILSLILIYLIYKNNIQKAKNREMLLFQEQQKGEIRELNLIQKQKIAEEEIYQLMIAQQNKYEEGKNSEKERMSLEIHDNVLSKLSGLNNNLETQMLLSGLKDHEQFNKILDGLIIVQNETRNIAHDLNKNIFTTNNESFIDVVTELTTTIKNHTAIKFTVKASTTVNWEEVNNTVKINLYRIIQEALHNIEKYAQAKNVTIVINQHENMLELTIIDDGKGFDITTNKEGIGLKNMQTRMDDLNGKFYIESDNNSGTKINLIVPI